MTAFTLAASAGCAAGQPAPHRIVPGHIDLARGPDGNTVILDAPQGLVVVDSGRHPEHARAILDHAARAGKPVIAVVNSHWHLDHTTGNRDILAVFPDARLVTGTAVTGALDGFLAQGRERARRRLADPALNVQERARITRALAAQDDRAALIARDPVRKSGPMKLGGRRVIVHHAPAAATEGDLWLEVPDEKLVIAGDLVVAPVPFFDTGCEKGWRTALDRIAKARWKTLIPGHGAVMDRAAFDRWHRAFSAWLDCAASQRKAGDCARHWVSDAAGFYSEGERGDVLMMAEAYVSEVLRAPQAQRMAYCTAGRHVPTSKPTRHSLG